MLTKLVNLSLSTGTVLDYSKVYVAIVTPLLKKASYDPGVSKNYRPVSNGKTIAHVVLSRLNDHLQMNGLDQDTRASTPPKQLL